MRTGWLSCYILIKKYLIHSVTAFKEYFLRAWPFSASVINKVKTANSFCCQSLGFTTAGAADVWSQRGVNILTHSICQGWREAPFTFFYRCSALTWCSMSESLWLADTAAVSYSVSQLSADRQDRESISIWCYKIVHRGEPMLVIVALLLA